jgi:dTDP-4-dehydrorhamnose 3,5-epimerase
MNILPLNIPDVLVFQPKVFADERGFFLESFNQRHFEEAIGRPIQFVQDNHSKSEKNVLRGMHYQIKQAQGKLIRVVSGAVFDVAVDLRQNSPTFGQWVSETLTAENYKQLWIPEGFAHGFVVLSDTAQLLYKTTDFWAPEYEQCIAWDDPKLGINWPIEADPLLSSKDRQGVAFHQARTFTS